MKSFLFDLNDTVLKHRMDKIHFAGLKYFGFHYPAALRKMNEVKDFYGKGEISEDEFFREIIKAGKGKISSESAKSLYRELVEETPGMLDFVKTLRSKGYKTVMLAGEGKEGMEFKRRDFYLDDHFDFIIATCDLKMLKNDVKFYKKALEIIRETPENCIFIDDNKKYLEAAKKAGIKGVHFKNVGKLKRETDMIIDK